MVNTPKLSLPLIDAAQANKIITHNEAISLLDTVWQLNVIEITNTPPGSPSNGDTYIVAGAGTGAWAGLTDHVVGYVNGAWKAFAPGEGWIAFDRDTGRQYVYDLGAWTALDSLTNTNHSVRFMVHLSADQSVAANTFAKVLYDVEDYDPLGVYDAVTNHRFTAPSAGQYKFAATMAWKQTGGVTPTVIRAKFVKNGSTDMLARFTTRALSGTSTSGDEIIQNMSIACVLAANDTVEVQQFFLAQASLIPGSIAAFWGEKLG